MATEQKQDKSETAQEQLIRLEQVYIKAMEEVNALKGQRSELQDKIIHAQEKSLTAFSELSQFKDKFTLAIVQKRDEQQKSLNEQVNSLTNELKRLRTRGSLGTIDELKDE